jgi:hypothetical protein
MPIVQTDCIVLSDTPFLHSTTSKVAQVLHFLHFESLQHYYVHANTQSQHVACNTL